MCPNSLPWSTIAMLISSKRSLCQTSPFVPSTASLEQCSLQLRSQAESESRRSRFSQPWEVSDGSKASIVEVHKEKWIKIKWVLELRKRDSLSFCWKPATTCIPVVSPHTSCCWDSWKPCPTAWHWQAACAFQILRVALQVWILDLANEWQRMRSRK